ncbi:MAG: HEAT repeat domain-containing protein [Deltaproteobacteria bacterium]|nr:HEAT repeat domain-containing protein [Deltaproteobacteria bacterium]
MPAINKILKVMLESDAIDRRCAAAMVAAEAKLRDKSLVAALIEALSPDNPVLSKYAMEAIVAAGRAAAKRAIPRLRELVGVAGVGEQAAEALAVLGVSAADAVPADWAARGVVERRAAAAILAQAPDAKAFDRLLEAFGAGADVRGDVVEAVRSKASRVPAKAWKSRLSALKKFIARKEWAERPDVREAALSVVPLAGDSTAFQMLIDWVGPRTEARLRRAALSSLGRFHDLIAKNTRALKALVHTLEDSDFDGVVSPTLSALFAVAVPKSFEKEMVKLLDSRHGPVRHFAIRRLGSIVSAKTTKRLVELLASDDPKARELAAEALKNHPAAVDALVARLVAVKDKSGAEVVTTALSGHHDRIKKAHIEKLSHRALSAIEANDAAAEVLVPWVRSLNHAAFRSLATLGAEKHRRAGRYREAARLLSQVLRDADAKTKFAYFLCDWKMTPRSPVIGMRMGDAALRTLSELLYDRKFEALRAIRGERALTPIDLFTIAFAFSDGGSEERLFARDLLKHIVKKFGRSKVAKHAKNKLKLLTQNAPKELTEEAADGDL